MASDIEKVLTVLQGIGTGDADLAARYIHPKKYTEHNPNAADGVEGFKEYVGRLPHGKHLQVVRAFQDGAYVVTQSDGLLLGQSTFFDIFRFEDGFVVEHWIFSAQAAPPNQSGHTQTDGPTEARPGEDTEKNKAFMREYYETFHIAGDHSQADKYFTGDLMTRHEPGVRDGVAEFLRDVAVLMQHRTIDALTFLLGQGDFVFILAQGTHEGSLCVYVDLYRVEDKKVVEHWGFPQAIPPPQEEQNSRGLL